jgi:mRNA interferase RelE/StbE
LAYNVVYKKSVLRDLKKISKSEARTLLNQLEKEISRKPGSYPALKGQFAGLRRLSVGDYRVIYVILEKEVLVLRIAHRREAYKKDFKK